MLSAADDHRLRVAFVIDKYLPFIGGAERQARLLARLVSDRLGHCDVFTAQPDAEAEASGVSIHPLGVSRPHRLRHLAVSRIAGDGAYAWFHRDLTFEFHTLYFTPRTLRVLLEREGFHVLALRTHLRAHPLYLGKGSRRWLQGPIHALGGLVNRGPCIEVIAARAEGGSR